MNVCDTCGYKIISNKVFEKHKATHLEDPLREVVKEGTHEAPLEEVVAPVEVVAEPVAPSTDITIRFMKTVEVTINGIHYEGKEIKVKDMSIASEIVRIAREAYGPMILA